jgi:ribonuclease HI
LTPTTAPDWRIVFDGGSQGNPGRGYGSYRLQRAGGRWEEPVRLEFGDRVTNNEAEYRSLIEALRDLAGRVGDPAEVRVEVLGDSKLVLSQLAGRWKVRADNLRAPYSEAQRLARAFKTVRYTWHRRNESVALLGH